MGAIYYLGPFPRQLAPPVSTIPLLCVPKPPVVDAVRVCGDCSFPAGQAVNDGIPLDQYCGEAYRCQLPTIWEFLAQVREIGVENVMLSKVDLSRGYRQLPIDPADWEKQLFYLEGLGYFLDTCGIFGCRSCGMFMKRTNQALAWAAVNTSVELDQGPQQQLGGVVREEHSVAASPETSRAVSTYIDDTLFATHRACAMSVWENTLSVFEATNVTLSSTPGHVSPPARSVMALGFFVDCDAGTVSIPQVKLVELVALAGEVLESGGATRKVLQVLLGRLARLIMIVREGRRFIGRLLTLIQGPVVPPSQFIALTEDARLDLQWWLLHGPSLNARTLITLPTLPRESVYLVDACGKQGDRVPSVGGLSYHHKEFFAMPVPVKFQDSPIHVLEAVVLLAASRLWVPSLPDEHIIPIGSDNMAVVMSYQHGRAREPSLAAMARLLWGVFACSGSTFLLRYVPSKENSSDGLSRLDSEHVSFLLDKGWTKVELDECFFDLDETDPFAYQRGTQRHSGPRPPVSSTCRLQTAPTGTGGPVCGLLSSSVGSSGSTASQPQGKSSSCSQPGARSSGTTQLGQREITWQQFGRSISVGGSSSRHHPPTSLWGGWSEGLRGSCRGRQERRSRCPRPCLLGCWQGHTGEVPGGSCISSSSPASSGWPVLCPKGAGGASTPRFISPGVGLPGREVRSASGSLRPRLCSSTRTFLSLRSQSTRTRACASTLTSRLGLRRLRGRPRRTQCLSASWRGGE